MVDFLKKARNIFLGPEFDEPETLPYEEYMKDETEIDDMDDIDDSDVVRFKRRGTTSSNTISLSNNVLNMHKQPKMEVVRTYPQVVSDAFQICDHIRDNKTCIVNLEGIEGKEAQRIADFLGGVAYAFKGDIQRISKGVFIVAPTTVEITGQLKEELKESGVIFNWVSAATK